MALSLDEKAKIIRMLDRMEDREKHKVLASLESFTGWLRDKCWDIFYKIADVIQGIWNTIKSIFG